MLFEAWPFSASISPRPEKTFQGLSRSFLNYSRLSWAVLARLGLVLACLGVCLGLSWRLSWLVLGCLGAGLGPSCVCVGPVGVCLDPIEGGLELHLGIPGWIFPGGASLGVPFGFHGMDFCCSGWALSGICFRVSRLDFSWSRHPFPGNAKKTLSWLALGPCWVCLGLSWLALGLCLVHPSG